MWGQPPKLALSEAEGAVQRPSFIGPQRFKPCHPERSKPIREAIGIRSRSEAEGDRSLPALPLPLEPQKRLAFAPRQA